jgi:hypothetical protein
VVNYGTMHLEWNLTIYNYLSLCRHYMIY